MPLGSRVQRGACNPRVLPRGPGPCRPQLWGWLRQHKPGLALLAHRWQGWGWGWALNQSIWLLVSSFLFLAGQRLGNSGCLSGAARAPGQSMLCQALSALQRAPVLLLTSRRPQVIGVVLGRPPGPSANREASVYPAWACLCWPRQAGD